MALQLSAWRVHRKNKKYQADRGDLHQTFTRCSGILYPETRIDLLLLLSTGCPLSTFCFQFSRHIKLVGNPNPEFDEVGDIDYWLCDLMNFCETVNNYTKNDF